MSVSLLDVVTVDNVQLTEKGDEYMLKILAIGNLGQNPEMRYLPSGTPVTNFSIATNRRWTNNDGEKQEETVWLRISCFGKLAENCNEYLSKGRQVYVEGRLRPDSETGGPRIWTGRDGEPRASFEVSASRVQFLGGGNGSPGAASEAPPAEGDDEVVPF